MSDNVKFKPGDKVVCIRADNSWDVLEEGKVYTVADGDGYQECVKLQEGSGIYWREDRFALYTEEPPTVTDPVNRPHHYARFKIEPIHFIMENNLPFWVGNVVKYTLRYDAKDGLQDLKKARRYLDMQIKKMEGDPKWSE